MNPRPLTWEFLHFELCQTIGISNQTLDTAGLNLSGPQMKTVKRKGLEDD